MMRPCHPGRPAASILHLDLCNHHGHDEHDAGKHVLPLPCLQNSGRRRRECIESVYTSLIVVQNIDRRFNPCWGCGCVCYKDKASEAGSTAGTRGLVCGVLAWVPVRAGPCLLAFKFGGGASGIACLIIIFV